MSSPLLRRARALIHPLVRPVLVLSLAVSPWASKTPAGAQGYAFDAHDPALPADQPVAGLHFGGLRPGAGPCQGTLEVPLARGRACTHGPDGAPAGVDARVRPSARALRARLRAHKVAAASAATAAATTNNGTVYCYGDGTTGKRIEAIYAHASNVTDRYSSLLPTLRGYAAVADGVYNGSASETGGIRHIRFVTDSSCNLVVRNVTLTTTGDDSFGNTVSELQAKGYNRADRHYMIWVDANVYCGIGSYWNDDRAGLVNYNASGTNYGRSDTGCWGGYTEAHELMHNLGGVQKTAPHSSGAGHCYDESDRMCYSDGGSYFTGGGTMQYPCASSHEYLFDCNHDDYFSTAPATGSYLATHWNVADSPFLDVVNGSTTAPPSTTTTAPPSTTTTAPPATTTTTRPPTASPTSAVFSGTASPGQPAVYTLATGVGLLSSKTTWSGFLLFGSPNLTVSVRDASGRILASRTGQSPLPVSVTVSKGTVTIVVSSPSTTSFRLSVSYPKG